MTTKEIIKVLQAFDEGKEIEWKFRREKFWKEATNPCWNFNSYDYRIKPQPKFVPFDEKDDLIGKIVRNEETNSSYLIIGQTNGGLLIGNGNCSYGFLFQRYTFLDGSICGKSVE